MTPLDLILSKLPQAKRTGSKRTTRCPAHDDQRASLSIGVGDDGRVLIHCHAGCTPEAVVAALGLTMADLMPTNNKKRTGTSAKARPTSSAKTGKSAKKGQEMYATAQDAVAELEHRHGPCSATWTYHDVSGEPVGVVVRWDKPSGKDIRPASKTINGWVIGGMPQPRPLYRLPDLLARRNEQVYVCEGEKAAEAAASIDLLATCSAHGAKSAAKSNWQPLAGRDVVILPDNDPAGEKYASDVRRLLLHLDPPAKVRIVRLPGLAEHGDIADFADSRDAAEPEALKAQVLGLVEKAELETEQNAGEAPQLDIVTLSKVPPQPVRWLWRERFPYGMLSLLVGIEGSGKTFVALDMAARISAGNLWPDAQGAEDAPVPGNVILMCSEDALAHTIVPRLDAMGADTKRIQAVRGIKYPEGRQFFNVLEHLPLLKKVIEQLGDVRLVLIDPLTAFLGKTDQNANAEVRDALVRLSDLAEQYGCAIIGISHFGKNTDRKAIHRTLGSVAFSATARAISLVNADEENPERRLLIPVKMNLTRLAKAMAFRIENMAVAWEPGQFDCNADALLGTARRNPALTRAKHWLQGLLAQGPVPQTKVQELAARVEPTIAERTLDRAKGALHVESKHEGLGDEGRWIWRLPDAPVASATDDGDEQ